MLTPFIFQYQKLTFANINIDVIERFHILSCQVHAGRYKFSKILSLAWKLDFCHWQQIQQILSAVFLEMTVSFHLFLKKCLPNTQVQIIRSSKNSAP